MRRLVLALALAAVAAPVMAAEPSTSVGWFAAILDWVESFGGVIIETG